MCKEDTISASNYCLRDQHLHHMHSTRTVDDIDLEETGLVRGEVRTERLGELIRNYKPLVSLLSRFMLLNT